MRVESAGIPNAHSISMTCVNNDAATSLASELRTADAEVLASHRKREMKRINARYYTSMFDVAEGWCSMCTSLSLGWNSGRFRGWKGYSLLVAQGSYDSHEFCICMTLDASLYCLCDANLGVPTRTVTSITEFHIYISGIICLIFCSWFSTNEDVALARAMTISFKAFKPFIYCDTITCIRGKKSLKEPQVIETRAFPMIGYVLITAKTQVNVCLVH